MNGHWDNLPKGITEDDLLGLVEGTLGEPRAAAVRAQLATRPDLLRLVDAMRADRAVVTAIEAPRAPAALVAAATHKLHEELHQHALSCDIVEPEVTTLRVSTVQPSRRPGVLASIVDLLASSTLARGLAVAAGFSLAAGVLLWGILAIVAEISQPVTVVRDDDSAIPAVEQPIRPAEDTRLAINDQDPAMPDLPEGPLAADSGTASEDLAEEALPTFPEAQPMSPERALALAREGRLAVRVRVGSPDVALARVENLRRRSERDGVIWRSLPADVSGAIHLAMAESLSLPVAPAGPRQPAVAGEGQQQDRLPVDDGVAVPAMQVGVLAAAYELQLAGSATTLESLRRGLTRDRFQIAEFVELPEPVETKPKADPRTMFWWDQPPARWEKVVRVPVLVETVE